MKGAGSPIHFTLKFLSQTVSLSSNDLHFPQVQLTQKHGCSSITLSGRHIKAIDFRRRRGLSGDLRNSWQLACASADPFFPPSGLPSVKPFRRKPRNKDYEVNNFSFYFSDRFKINLKPLVVKILHINF